MDQNPSTPSSNRNQNTSPNNPFYDQSYESPQNLSFTGMLQQPDYPPRVQHQAPMPFPQLAIPFPPPPLYYNPNQNQNPNPNPNAFQRFSQSQGYQPFHVSQQSPRSQQSPQSQPSPQSQQSQSSQQSQPMPESVPETQVDPAPARAPAKRKHKKKGKAKEPTASGRILWDEDEEACLTRAWISISEDGLRGNAQDKNQFWERIANHFFHQRGLGEYRTIDMLCSKWRDLQKDCTAFNGIFNNAYRMWESGKKDFDVLNAAHQTYRETVKSTGFAHVKSWTIMQEGPKWIFQRDLLTSSDSNKRSRTSVSDDYMHYSDANTTPFNLNDDVTDIERPDGRNKERDRAREARGKRPATSRQSDSNREQDLGFFKDVFQQHLELKKSAVSQFNMDKDLKMLKIKTEDVDEENREIVKNVQKTIRDRLKNAFKW